MMSKPQEFAVTACCERDLAGEHAGEIAARRAAELDVDIGEAEIAVEQQRLAPGERQRVRERDREPGLADPALAGGDGDDVVRFSGCRRRHRGRCFCCGRDVH